jgi:hypothetical protein
VQQEEDVPAPVQQQEEEEEEVAVVVPGALKRKRSVSPVDAGPRGLSKRQCTPDRGSSGGGIPRPFGQAGASGLVIPNASRHAGSQLTTKPFAGSDTLERVNKALVDQGFPEFNYVSNEYVIRHYGECSTEGHAMLGLLRDGILDEWRASVQLAQRDAVVSGPDGCLDVEVRTFATKSIPVCPTCNKKPAGIAIVRHRVVAMLHEPPENLWMMFVYLDKTSPKTRMFEASHRCCIKSPNTCIRPEHVFLETVKTNGERTQHQRGNKVCDHADLPCLSIKQFVR